VRDKKNIIVIAPILTQVLYGYYLFTKNLQTEVIIFSFMVFFSFTLIYFSTGFAKEEIQEIIELTGKDRKKNPNPSLFVKGLVYFFILTILGAIIFSIATKNSLSLSDDISTNSGFLGAVAGGWMLYLKETLLKEIKS